jgi:protoheme IX farnesyltransferase
MSHLIQDYLSLAKLRLSALVILTSLIGIFLAPGPHHILNCSLSLIGISLLVASANAFNCYIERDVDAFMERTKNRPLPSNRMTPISALIFASILFVISFLLLFHFSNTLTTLLGLLAFFSYVALYTPMKRQSMWALFVGAIPGAIPPMMGWTLVRNSVDVTAWILFGILFLWQLPHFISIAMFREKEYENAGLKTLPGTVGWQQASQQLFLYTCLLIIVSLLPCFFGVAGFLYLMGASISGFAFLALCARSLKKFPHPAKTRLVFFATLVYLPIVLGMWVFDKLIGSAS